MAPIIDANSAALINRMSRLQLWMQPVHVPESHTLLHGVSGDDDFGFEEWRDDNISENPLLTMPIMDNSINYQEKKYEADLSADHQTSDIDNEERGQNFIGRLFALPEKRSFCSHISKDGCLRCQRKQHCITGTAMKVPKMRSKTWSSKSFNSSSTYCSSESNTAADPFVDAIMNMKIGIWKTLPIKTCGFCYIQYKRHCQKLGTQFPRPEDPGFWLGHNTKDENGCVTCPELRKLVCPLCFSYGDDAHTLKFCPLLGNNNNN